MRAPAPRPVHTYQREATPSEHAQWDKAAPKLGLPVGKAGTAVDLWLSSISKSAKSTSRLSM